ncbi:MAG: prephenate dehydrogenase/arogenate dehydrogenase family protein [Gammaproteobacteria bacterium]|nr:prephenate dehydrogenase/arogenate dehydrogenase family protein [Gammaproteobacteria bacterium]
MSRSTAILGVGLIGGSLARALRRAGACAEIVGCASTPAEVGEALELGVIDRGTTAVAAAVAGCDLVVLAVPVGAMRAVFAQLAPALGADTVVTDVGSVKGAVIADARAALAAHYRLFVPGHPVAGTERSGVQASFAALFDSQRVILTPTAETDRGAVDRVTAMWQAAGARVEEMDAGHHDEVLAATSHLPHVLAFALVEYLAGVQEAREVFRFAGGGFRDFTRIAASSAPLWCDIVFANRPAVLASLEGYDARLRVLTEALRRGDVDAVRALFERAGAARRTYARDADPPAVPGGSG